MISSRISAMKLLAACCIDLVVGDPHELPHPVRWMGGGISAGERLLRRQPSTPAMELLQGSALVAAVVAGSWAAARLALGASRRVQASLGDLTEILLAWTALAMRSLIVESGAVLEALDAGDLLMARKRLAMIVGRDTVSLDESEIARAVKEDQALILELGEDETASRQAATTIGQSLPKQNGGTLVI